MRIVSIDVAGRNLKFAVHEHNDKHVSERIATDGVWEPFETQVMQRLVRPGDLVADCGANIGWYTIVAAALGASVVAFEPLPANATLLRDNVALNGFTDQVEVHQVGLGSHAGHATLELSDFNQGDHRIVAQASGRKATVTVETRTLDAVLGHRQPALIKLDTQGSEVAILRGGRGAWDGVNPSPVIVLEFWPYGLQRCGASVEQLLEILEALVDVSHSCYEVLEWRQSLTPLDAVALRRMAFEGGFSAEMKGFTNLVLVPLDRVAEIADLVLDAPIFG